MGLQTPSYVESAHGWILAIRNFHQNPLPRHWTVHEHRQALTRKWWNRSPGLMVMSLLISLLVTAYCVLLILRMAAGWPNPAARVYFPHAQFSSTTLLLLGGALVTMLWVMARYFKVIQTALGFLEVQPQRRMQRTLDDMLAISALSEQEIITGIGLFSLRLMLPPLLTLCALGGLGLVYTLYIDPRSATAWTAGEHTFPVFITIAGGILLSLVQMLIGACLAVLINVYLCVTVSLAERSGVVPFFGAAGHVLFQWYLIVKGVMANSAWLDSTYNTGLHTYIFLLGIPMLIVAVLCFYLARRIGFLRLALAAAFPVLLVTACLVLEYTVLANCYDYGELTVCQAYAYWPLQVFSMFDSTATAPVGKFPDVFQEGTYPFLSMALMPVMLGLKLAVLSLFACFARDAIQRRKWSSR